jgi:anti-anti-sigma regulatory factor
VLRIVRKDREAHHVVLVLQGHIFAEWAELLERECLILSKSGERVSLDCSDVAFISRSGFEVLGRLVRSGVEIFACPPLIADMLEHEGVGVVRDLPTADDA